MTESSLKRKIRSFVRRPGRMTPGQRRALNELWPLYGIDPQSEPLTLNSIFAQPAPCVMEIGFGMGESLLTQACADPTTNFIGVEVHEPGVGRLLAGIQHHELANLKIICHDAIAVLQQCIPAASLAGMQIFFPDPWPKKKHHKRRLIQTPFLDLVCSRLQPEGVLHIATDWAPYAEHIEATCAQHSQLQAIAQNPLLAQRPRSRFAERGKRLGHGEWDFVYCAQTE